MTLPATFHPITGGSVRGRTGLDGFIGLCIGFGIGASLLLLQTIDILSAISDCSGVEVSPLLETR